MQKITIFSQFCNICPKKRCFLSICAKIGLIFDFSWKNPGEFKCIPWVKSPKYTYTLIQLPPPNNVLAHKFQWFIIIEFQIDNLEEMLDVLEGLSTDSAKFRAKRDRKLQRCSFRQILAFLNEEGRYNFIKSSMYFQYIYRFNISGFRFKLKYRRLHQEINTISNIQKLFSNFAYVTLKKFDKLFIFQTAKECSGALFGKFLSF